MSKKFPQPLKISRMQVSTALFVFVIVALIVFFIARSKLKFFSSLVLALLIGALVLAALVNPMDLINSGQDSVGLYGLVMAVISIILLIYIIVKVSQDVDTSESGWHLWRSEKTTETKSVPAY